METTIDKSMSIELKRKKSKKLKRDIFNARYLYILLLPVFLYYVVFHYSPMYGIIIAFKDYTIGEGIFGSRWVGFEQFRRLFASTDFYMILRNSILINIYDLIFNFPIPIILALLLNEVMNKKFKSVIQSVLYMPHFLSWVILSGMLIAMLSPSTGIINYIIKSLGAKEIFFMSDKFWWIVVYTFSSTWKEAGWGTIIYLAAISGVNPELYEAARIDGANKFQQVLNVTVPGIRPTISILLILRMGSMISVGFEKVYLLQNDYVRSISEVFSTYVFRMGIERVNYSYSTAVGLFQSLINLILLLSANKIVKMLGDDGWM